jgi:hypothetical protein
VNFVFEELTNGGWTEERGIEGNPIGDIRGQFS